MERLSKRKSIIKGQLTKMTNYIDANGTEMLYDDLKARLDNVHRLYSEFVQVEDAIFDVDDKALSEMDVIDDNYYRIVAKIQSLLRNNGTSSSRLDESISAKPNSNASSDFKLPSLPMPTFDGNLLEWQSFFDIYTSTIHENISLTAAQKFKYLKGLLKGNAYDLIKHFRVDDASYLEAYQRLTKRYNKKKPIVESYIRNLIEQPKISKGTFSSITQMHDNLDEVVRGLKALGQEAESRDPWLIYIILDKLDEDTKKVWKYETAETDFPTLQELLDFLLKRMSALTEGPAGNSKSIASTSYKRLHVKGQSSAKTFHISTNVVCPLCPGETHRLFECQNFIAQSITQRREFLKNKSRCFNCLSETHSVYQCKTKRRCRICNKKHNTLVHLNNETPTEAIQSEPSTNSAAISAHASCYDTRETVLTSFANGENAILPTAVVEIQNGMNSWQEVRGLLDSASTRSFITESCVNRLKLSRSNARIIIKSINESNACTSRGIANIRIRSRLDHNYTVDIAALIVANITANLPPMDLEAMSFDTSIPLADPSYYQSRSIDILIGCDHFLNTITGGKITSSINNLVAIDTRFGWIVGGICNRTHRARSTEHAFLTLDEELNIDRLLRRFWEIEEIEYRPLLTEEEIKCIDYYKDTVTRSSQGRIIVSLPFRHRPPHLGESFNQARHRFHALERKLCNNPSLRCQYENFIEEYLKLGHMELVPPNEIVKPVDTTFYLPHHGVFKESSSTTKLRVVFDGSAKTKTGYSLNDQLMTGPTVQQNLTDILLRFRKYKYVFSADVEKMYRQFMVQKADADYQRILWRSSPTKPLNHYRLLTVTYGTSSAPFLATFSLQYLADQLMQKFPRTATVIKRDFYVDDLMSGAHTLEEALILQQEIIQTLLTSGLKLRKWAANHSDLLMHIPTHDLEISEREYNDGLKTVSILGIFYQPKNDVFKFRVNIPTSSHTTKRQLLSEASRLFDPIGWLSPVTIVIKCLFQKLWLEKLDWDDEIPDTHKMIWSNFRNELPTLEQLQIPRWLNTKEQFEIHGFADASQEAYAAVLYARTLTSTKDVKVNLITAKTKVAPIKSVSIPKLELCAASLLVKLLETTIKSLTLTTRPIVYLYSDSTIVLNWLSKHPKTWPTYIANRTSQILTHTNRNQWHHITSLENPADCASRGLRPNQLINHQLWWSGPNMLHDEPIQLPKEPHELASPDDDTGEAVTMLSCSIEYDEIACGLDKLSTRVSRYPIILRVLARIGRWVFNARKANIIKKTGALSTSELLSAETRLFLLIQRSKFRKEVDLLNAGVGLKQGKLINFFPFLDKSGLLRVSGRLGNAAVQYDTKYPIILPGDHPIVLKMVAYLHIKLLHAGPSQLLFHTREKFQIIRAKELIRKVVRQCMKCHRQTLKTQTQLMGQLPSSRVALVRPFQRTGIDYAGPYSIKAHQFRKSSIIKGYLAIFVCMATKAVHFEVVTNLSTETFIAALKRFHAVRGISSDIYSDNGTNFVGVKNKLQEIAELLTAESTRRQIYNWSSEQRINWHFIPPAAPSFGGLWEAAVKSTKFHIRRVIGDTVLNYEELLTLMKQIEAVLNSRPLCKLDDSDNPLTPAHFLVGHSLTLMPEPNLTDQPRNVLSRWQMLQGMLQHFWRRWQGEYLTSLNRLSKWNKLKNQPKLNEVVILRDDNTPPAKWPLAKIIELHPGPDNLIRVVTIQTSSGIYKRPIQKICILPKIDSSESSEAVC